MRSTVLIAAVSLTLAACASQPPASAPACKGERRPANPFGSVLSDSPGTPKPAEPDKAAPSPPCGGPVQ